ncbi:hypothetical protein Tsubulata_013999 [Turnera subulata]|uniref:Uncharacterized protein n=1 Tax=Turnera subulata TaxID=218843 RepID=A0A9Q0JHH8_9ROSI|nr:hypothetical protein Tsubulata_013999 [Turnera subulata]
MAYRRRQQNQNQSHSSLISVSVPVSNSEEEAADVASSADIHDDSKKNEFLATKAIRDSSAAACRSPTTTADSSPKKQPRASTG